MRSLGRKQFHSKTQAIKKPLQPSSNMKIGIPVINRGDLLEQCVASIDEPVERVLVVANKWGAEYEPSVERALNKLSSSVPKCIGTFEIFETGGNLGDGGSFNCAMAELGPCIVASNDAMFTPGSLLAIDAFIARNQDCVLHFLYAMCVFSVTPLFFERVGYFDENFWPWGWCDIDLSYRMQKYGHKTQVFTREMGRIVHDHPTQSINASPEALKKWMQQMSARNANFGIAKWSLDEKAFFSRNKNNKWAIESALLGNPGQAWQLDREIREERRSLLLKATGIDTPLVFCKEDNSGVSGCDGEARESANSSRLR